MTEPILLDAISLGSWQSCKRAALLHHDYRVLLSRPKSLFDQCLRKAIVAISAGGDVSSAAADASSTFLEYAASPGLDLPSGADPYRIAKDYCVMFDTILQSLARTPLLTLSDPPPVPMNSFSSWRVLAHADDSGTLHRWITVDAWTDDDLARELHSWRTIGDLAFTGSPMMLHVIVIGQMRAGRRSSPFARAYRHPTMPSLRLKFRRADGSDLSGWKPYYLADHPDADREEWVSRMFAEGVTASLIYHLSIDCPPEDICAATRSQVMYEAVRIREALADRGMVPWSAYPMSRNACDSWTPCAFQSLCYSPTPPDPRTIGLYQSRIRDTVSRTGRNTINPRLPKQEVSA